MKCPNCEANIQINEEDNRILFCQYCGNQLFFDDGIRRSEHRRIVEHKTVIVDKAEIKKSDNNCRIRMRELDSEDDWRKSYNRSQKFYILFPVIIFSFILIFELVEGVSGCVRNNKQDKLRAEMELQGKISAGYYSEYIGKNYKAVINDLTEKGFTNIETLDLNDAGGFSIFAVEEDTIDSISIKGNKEFSEKDYFNPDDKIFICYH